MTTLILDKSMVKAARKGVIEDLRSDFDFLLPDVLLHEIMTENLDKRQTLASHQIDRLDNMIHANMRRATTEAGNHWIAKDEAVAWEIVEGRSARYAPTMNIQHVTSIYILSKEEMQNCLDDDARLGDITAAEHATEDDAWFAWVRTLKEKVLFEYLANTLSSEEAVRSIGEKARIDRTKDGISRGLVVSPNFKPTHEWFSFGINLAVDAFLKWKFWKYGDARSDTKKPANPFYDTMYIATIAIADGIISGDKNLLKLAWACWPDKRGNIYDYDTQEHQIIPFEPQWSA